MQGFFAFGTLGISRVFLLTVRAKPTNICKITNKIFNTRIENLQGELLKESNRDFVYRWPVFWTDLWEIQFSIITKYSRGNLLPLRDK